MDIQGYELPVRKVYITETGVSVDPATVPTEYLALIECSMFDVIDDNIKLSVALTGRKGADATALTLYDINCNMVWFDPVYGDELYVVNGQLADGTGVNALQSLVDYAMNNGDFETFTLTLGASATPAMFLSETNPAGNPLTALRANKKAVATVLGVPIVEDAPPALYLEDVVKDLTSMEVNPTYIVVEDVSNLQVLDAVFAVQDKINCHVEIEFDGALTKNEIKTLVNTLSLKDYRTSITINQHKSLPFDAKSTKQAKVHRPVLGVLIGYALLRNAATNTKGIAKLQNAIAGKAYPINFAGMEANKNVEDMRDFYSENNVNGIVLERYESGSKFIVHDVKTCYDAENPETSLLSQKPAAEIATYSANRVNSIVRSHLLTNMADYLDNATKECTDFLDDCTTTGLFVPANNLGGKAYSLSIKPRESRNDAVDVTFGRRPEGTVRAVFTNTTVER